MTWSKVLLLVASNLILVSCNRHLSDVFFDNNSRVSESLFGDDFSETAPPVFFDKTNDVQFLDKYPFEKGGYAIVGLLSESDPNALQDEIGEFFTDDVDLLNEFKKTWTFSKGSAIYTGDYHYNIYVTRHGKILEAFAVNLNNNIIASEKGYFYFDPKKLSQFKDQLKKPKADYQAFGSLSDGRAYFLGIVDNKDLLLAYDPIWLYYEGKFNFILKSDGQKLDRDHIEKRLKANLRKNFPKQAFECTLVSYSTSGEYEFELVCKKSLFDQFNIYPKHNWEPYDVILVTYWSDKHPN